MNNIYISDNPNCPHSAFSDCISDMPKQGTEDTEHGRSWLGHLRECHNAVVDHVRNEK